ncbi:hypothetical protein Sjap_014710 [Stephania japonica]|uniref:Uncharacterized protein n=1 Tax=Stephania japonica TaxID=461633 RepID=A0AAP0NQP9_9MAGN
MATKDGLSFGLTALLPAVLATSLSLEFVWSGQCVFKVVQHSTPKMQNRLPIDNGVQDSKLEKESAETGEPDIASHGTGCGTGGNCRDFQ